MNKWITSLFAVALTGSVAFADVAAPAIAAKDLEKVVDEAIYVETATKGVVLSGYVDAGYIYNFTNASNPSIFGRNATDGQAKGDFSLNAFKLTLQKALSDKNEFQAGFRADVKIGEDASNLNTRPLAPLDQGSSDTVSLDQAYIIVRAPIGNGLDITVGKFAALLGYEVDDRPANLNITHGYDYVFQTSHQTGVKLFYPVNDIIELQLAVTNGSGIDTNANTVGNLTDTSSDGYAVNATVNIKAPGGNANWFNGIYVSEGTADGFTNDESAFQWNSWGNWAPKFANDKLLLGFSTTLGDSSDSDDTVGSDGGYTYFTGSLYAKYQFTQIFSLAGRGSYLHSIDGAPLAVSSAENGDAYSFTLTAGFNLLENLLVRAEYRADVITSADQGIANTVAVQAVYTF
jgi:hypothetical protein